MEILFVGNSHTYVNGLPYQVSGMVNHLKGFQWCRAWMVACGGKSLSWHAEQPDTQLNIACNRWDYVVLQQRTHPFPPYEELAGAVCKLMPHIRQAGAEALFYVTWKRKEAPDTDQEEINSAFDRVAGQFGGKAIPVGQAWAMAARCHPDIELYASDGRHASPAGTYLGACVFARVLTGQSARGLPSKILANGKLLVDLDPVHARALQEVADGVVLNSA